MEASFSNWIEHYPILFVEPPLTSEQIQEFYLCARRSFDFRTGKLDDFGPFVSFFCDEPTELGGRHWHRCGAESSESRLEGSAYLYITFKSPPRLFRSQSVPWVSHTH